MFVFVFACVCAFVCENACLWMHSLVCHMLLVCLCIPMCVYVCACVCQCVCVSACMSVSVCVYVSWMLCHGCFLFYLLLLYAILPCPFAYLHCLLLLLIFSIWTPRSCFPRRFFLVVVYFPFTLSAPLLICLCGNFFIFRSPAKLLPIEIFQYHLMRICTDQYYCIRKARHKYTSALRNQ